MKKNLLVIVIVIVIVIGGAAFYGGMAYGKSQGGNRNLRSFNGQMPAGATGANFRGGNGANATNGEVIAKDDQSVTIQLRDNGSKIIFVSDSTQVSKMAAGSIADVEVGQNLMVTGTTNSDGSISAETIQIRPAGTFPGGPNSDNTNANQ